MATLVEVLADPVRKRAVIEDGVALIDREVASKSGLSGMAVKAGFKTFKAIKPGIVAHALDLLLPAFAPAVDPHFARAVESGDVRGWFVRHGDTIAESLLGVTDEKAAKATQRVMVRVYHTLRPTAKGHVVAAMPGLADLITRHVR